jgi:putative modified peptide
MTPDPADRRLTISLTPTEARDFLLRLASDDAFRSRLEQQPEEVLAEHHIHLPAEHVPSRSVLPSKELLRRALENFTARGEIDLEGLFSPAGWPIMLFWWLYLTPAKPPRNVNGGAPSVRARAER